ncbi:9752_t:CDS:2, partial [Acaulospora colombiana]
PLIETTRADIAVGQAAQQKPLKELDIRRAKAQDYYESLGGGLSSEITGEQRGARTTNLTRKQRLQELYKKIYPIANIAYELWIAGVTTGCDPAMDLPNGSYWGPSETCNKSNTHENEIKYMTISYFNPVVEVPVGNAHRCPNLDDGSHYFKLAKYCELIGKDCSRELQAYE